MTGRLQSAYQRDRLMILSGLAVILLLSWGYMVYLAADMQPMASEMAMPRMQTWGIVDFAAMFIMWSVMMVAMMIPSASPMILAYGGMKRKQTTEQNPAIAVAMFVLGYLVVWIVFSAFATALQWFLHELALLSPMMVSTSPLLGGGMLIAAGIFQWTPFKNACLNHCRTPLGFFMTEWRDGHRGALSMGLRHGTFCVGCCWLIMALLFVAGVMNLLWVAAIAGFVLLEKVAPRGEWTSRIAGLVMVVWGIWMIAGLF